MAEPGTRAFWRRFAATALTVALGVTACSHQQSTVMSSGSPTTEPVNDVFIPAADASNALPDAKHTEPTEAPRSAPTTTATPPTAPRSTAPLAPAPTTAAPSPATTPTRPAATIAPVASPSPAAAAAAVNTANLTWVCRGDEASPQFLAQRHASLIDNIRHSGLPDSSAVAAANQLALIEYSLPLYCAAERLTGVPALLLAAIHYREANNAADRSMMSGEVLGAINPDTGAVEGTSAGENAVRAAQHLIGNARSVYGINVNRLMTTVDVVYSLAAYNRGGRYCAAGQLHPMNSPYVASGLFPETIGMRWPDIGEDGAGPWGEPASVRGQPDYRLGALTLMRALGSEVVANAYAWDLNAVQIACR